MMGKGLIEAQLNTIAGLLKELEMLRERNYPTYPPNPASIFRNLKYADIWSLCFKEQYYDFLLEDHSILQFRFDIYQPSPISYSFYDCPFENVISFQDFLEEQREFNPGSSVIEVAELFELYRSTLENKDTVTPIRYDYEPKNYRQAGHPASHVHVGQANNIRIGIKRVLRPISFTLLILRQYYPDKWTKFLSMPDASNLCRNIREHLDPIDESLWSALDEHEMRFE